MNIGFSSCPNDTFIFDAIIHKKVDTEGMEFNIVIKDIEELNKMALSGELDVAKLSVATYFTVMERYTLLNSGSAMGKNCGPLLISKKNYALEDLKNLKIAIPGKHTTANFLLDIIYPGLNNKTERLFSEIENAVLNGEADAGLIIHESRFTYKSKGLKKIADLGEQWEKMTGLPVPLGCIAIKKELGEEIKVKFDRVLRRSVEFALNNPESSKEFVKAWAKELSEDVIRKHIELYVNEYTIDMGDNGRKAIRVMGYEL